MADKRASSNRNSKDTESLFSIEQVHEVLVEKLRAGMTDEVRDLLASFGAEKLSDIDPMFYSELIDAAKKLKSFS